MESGTFPQTLCFARFLACSSDFTLSSYRKKPPLSSAFNPHEHELLEASPPGERPAAARGSRPHRQKSNSPAAVPEREETDGTPNQKPKRGCDCCPGRSCQHGFWRGPSQEDSLPRQGGAVRPGRNQTARPQCRRERKPMEHRTRSQKGAATAALDGLVSMVFGAVPAGETACRGRGEPSAPTKIKRPGHSAGERGNR